MPLRSASSEPLGAIQLMTRHLIGILFSSFLFLTQSFGQIHSKECLESCRGCLVTPIDNYKEVHDITFRRSEHTFDNTDSSLSFVTDNVSKVKAACDGKVVSIEHDKSNSFTLITKTADYFVYYSRLTKPSVRVGDKVRAGQKLAKLTKEHDELSYQLDFGIYTTDTASNLRSINVIKWMNL